MRASPGSRRFAATLGLRSHKIIFSTPTGLRRAARPRRNPVGVEWVCLRRLTQGSPPAADNPGLEVATPLALKRIPAWGHPVRPRGYPRFGKSAALANVI
jgi:hypothetical protein